MTTLPISKPVLAGLLLTLVASLLTALMPARSDTVTAEIDLLNERIPKSVTTSTPANRFVRPANEGSKAPISGFVATAPVPVEVPMLQQPSPPQPEQTTPEPSGPPPVPFAYLGQLNDEQRTVLFLQTGEDALAVVPGERVNSSWQLDSVRDDALVFRHLPTQQTQTLRTGP